MELLRQIMNAYSNGSFIINAHGGLSGDQFKIDENFHFITISPLGKGVPDEGERLIRHINGQPNEILSLLNHEKKLGNFFEIRHHPPTTMMNDIYLEFKPFFAEHKVPLGIRTFPLPASFIDRTSMSVENPYNDAIMFSQDDYHKLNSNTILLSRLINLLKQNNVAGGVFIVWTCRICDESGDETIDRIIQKPMRQTSGNSDKAMSSVRSALVQAIDEKKMTEEKMIADAIQGGITYASGPIPQSRLTDIEIKIESDVIQRQQEKISSRLSLLIQSKKKDAKLDKSFKCMNKKYGEEILQTLVNNQNPILTQILASYSNKNLDELKTYISIVETMPLGSKEDLIHKCQLLSVLNYALVGIAKKKSSFGWYDLIENELEKIEVIVANIESTEVKKYKVKYARYYKVKYARYYINY
jgi:hypothetical protein